MSTQGSSDMMAQQPISVFSTVAVGDQAIKIYRQSYHFLIDYLQNSIGIWCLTLVLQNNQPSVVAILEFPQFDVEVYHRQREEFSALVRTTYHNQLNGTLLPGGVNLDSGHGSSFNQEFVKYSQKVKCGTSISLKTEPRSNPSLFGSFGAFMVDKKSNRVFGLTSAHNLAVYSQREVDGDLTKRTQLHSSGIHIECPAITHYRRDIEDSKEEIARLEETIEENRGIINNRDLVRLEDELQDLKTTLKVQEEKSISEDQVKFGTTTQYMELRPSSDPDDLLASSPKNGKTLIDYALFEVEPDRISSNVISASPNQKPKLLGNVVPLREGQNVFKAGCVSGITFAVVSPVEIHVGRVPRFPQDIFAFRGVSTDDGPYAESSGFMTMGDSGGVVVSNDKIDEQIPGRRGLVGLCQGVGSGGYSDARIKLAFFQQLTHVVRNAKKTFGLDLAAFSDIMD